jgi:hypothetical protein
MPHDSHSEVKHVGQGKMKKLYALQGANQPPQLGQEPNAKTIAVRTAEMIAADARTSAAGYQSAGPSTAISAKAGNANSKPDSARRAKSRLRSRDRTARDTGWVWRRWFMGKLTPR